MERLPQELIDAIIDNLRHDDDPCCLRCCSLVCRTWVPASQRNLFHSMTIDRAFYLRRRPEDAPLIRRLYQILNESPHLSGYVKVLELELHDLVDYKDEKLPLVLRMLWNVENLTVDLGHMPWTELTQDVVQALHWVLQLPSLRFVDIAHVFFDHINDLARFLRHARSVTCLSFYSINFKWIQKTLALEDAKEQGEGEGREDNAGQILNLRNERRLSELRLAYINDDYRILECLLEPRSPFKVSHIHTLNLYTIHQNSGNVVNRLLHDIGNSLKVFRLGVPDTDRSGAIAEINLNFNLEITLLRVATVAEFEDVDVMPWFQRLLSSVNTSNRLEEIQVEVDFDSDCMASEDWSPWKHVDWILARAHFKFLRKLDFTLAGYIFGTPQRLPRVREKLVDVFSLTRERGVSVCAH